MLKLIATASLAVVLHAAPAAAQDLGPIYHSKAEIADIAAKAAATVQPGHGTSSRPLFALGDYTAKLEYHVAPGFANTHPQQAELFQAVEGSGTLVTGGTIIRTGNVGTSIVGGTSRHVAAGDVFVVPEGMPHWFSQVDGHMVLISIMLPRSATTPAK